MLLNVILLLNLFTPNKLAFCASLISVIAISVAIYAIIKQKRGLDPHRLASIFLRSNQVKQYINAQVEAKLKELYGKGKTPAVNTDKIVDTVIEEVRRLQKLDEREKEEERQRAIRKVEEQQRNANPKQQPAIPQEIDTPTEHPTQQNVVKSEVILFATAVDETDNNTFVTVSETPTKGETIFKFTEIQKGRCEFEVYEGATSLVLKESEYLNGACAVDKIGNSKVITTQKGVAELNTEGKWVVKEPAKVKFE